MPTPSGPSPQRSKSQLHDSATTVAKAGFLSTSFAPNLRIWDRGRKATRPLSFRFGFGSLAQCLVFRGFRAKFVFAEFKGEFELSLPPEAPPRGSRGRQALWAMIRVRFKRQKWSDTRSSSVLCRIFHGTEQSLVRICLAHVSSPNASMML
eukprot:scaffold7392_cov286-Pinguiococcus_pyrenoidosus.AAC.13